MKKYKTNLLQVLCATLVLFDTPIYAGDKDKYGGREAVEIDISEWSLTLSKEKVKAGNVGFAVKNKGEETHELAIIKLNNDTMMPIGKLPVNQHGAIDEDAMTFGQLVGEMEDIKSGDSPKQLFRLEPGRYAVICNMLEKEPDGTMEAHYSMGMHAVLEVE
jgi:hypothetical protein